MSYVLIIFFSFCLQFLCNMTNDEDFYLYRRDDSKPRLDKNKTRLMQNIDQCRGEGLSPSESPS